MKIFDNVTLTDSYTGNRVEQPRNQIVRSTKSVMFVDYTKGDESKLEILVELSNMEDVEGAEDWFQLSHIDKSTGLTEPFVPYLEATAKIIIDIPVNTSEDKARISIRRVDGTSGGAGTVTMYFV